MRFADGKTSGCKLVTDRRGRELIAKCDRRGRIRPSTPAETELEVERETKVEEATCRGGKRPQKVTCRVAFTDRPDETRSIDYLPDGDRIVSGGSSSRLP